MALENTVAKYEINVQKTGTGGQDAANELKKASAASSEAGESLHRLKEAANVTKESMHGLAETAAIMGASKFPELTESLMGLRTAMMLTRSLSGAFGVSLATMVPIMGALGAAAVAGVTYWELFGNSTERAKQQAEEMKKTLSEIPALMEELKTIQEAKGGISFSMWGQGVNAKSPAEALAQAFDSWGNFLPERFAEIKKGLEGAITPQVEAVARLKAITESAEVSALSGFEKERATATRMYDELIAKATEYGALTGNAQKRSLNDYAASRGLPAAPVGTEDTDALNAVQSAKSAALAAIDKKQQDAAIKATFETVKAQFAAKQELMQMEAETAKKNLEDQVKNENELGALKNKIALDSLSGAAKEKFAIDQWYLDEVDKINEVAQALRLEQPVVKDLLIAADQAHAAQIKAAEDLKKNQTQADQQAEKFINDFNDGLVNAMMQFGHSANDAKKAFQQLGVDLLKELSSDLMKDAVQSLLKPVEDALKDVLKNIFSAVSKSAFAATGGAQMMAGGGMAGVSSATYLPRFNVVAGEAGREMLTVLTKPRFLSVGGIEAMVGNVGNQRMA